MTNLCTDAQVAILLDRLYSFTTKTDLGPVQVLEETIKRLNADLEGEGCEYYRKFIIATQEFLQQTIKDQN